MAETDEIADIMAEINSLQKGMADAQPDEEAEAVAETPAKPIAAAAPRLKAVAEPVPEAAEPGLEDFHADASPDASMEDTLAGLKEDEPPTNSILDEEVEETMAAEDTGTEGSLSMTVNGSMSLKLKYEFGGQEVTIRFVDHCLKVELSDGTEFKIPVRAATKAA